MFSHVVIFWTKPDVPEATEKLLAGAEQYLKPCPGVLHYHCGKMSESHRDVVDQSYQVALNLVFEDKTARMPTKSIQCTWSSSRKYLNPAVNAWWSTISKAKNHLQKTLGSRILCPSRTRV